MSRVVAIALVLIAGSASFGATAPAVHRPRLVVGAPDRLPSVGDRRLPRRWDRADSAIAAYADVDTVVDPMWLTHELEGYAHRFACETASDCDRRLVPLDTGRAIRLASAGRAELLWTSGHHVVRLGWRRVVSTPTGTMTVEQPPAGFLAEILGTWPSDLGSVSFAPGRRAAWREADADRRLYYLDVALRAAGAPEHAAMRYFARAALRSLGAPVGDLSHSPALQLARDWTFEHRAARLATRRCDATPWCPLPSLSDVPPVIHR